jgi:predicted unusual protein kinase regulating ubiquinone biosynthesis (AarF/ABC1/UbiB family)
MIPTTPSRPVNRRRRFTRVVRLFLRLMLSFGWSYGRARLSFGAYNFIADRDSNRARACWIRNTALEMGGVIIKVGQFLSTRVDLLPDEYIEELALLQDEVPSVSFELIQRMVEQSFTMPLAEVFASFDPTPIASASLGQAHRAMLWTGQTVVVKVKRPGIDQIVEADLSALRFVIGQLNHWSAVRRRVDLPAIFQEFTRTLREELDYVAEAHNAERLGVAFAENPRVLIPRVYWSHVRRDVITLEYVPGIKVTAYERIEEAGISRSELAEILLQSYLQQFLVDGFFHADPHPGNVFARPGPTLVLVDFGMVGRLTARMRNDLRDVFLGIVKRDFNAIVRALVRLHFVRPGADLALIRRTVIWTVDTFYEMSFAELRDVDPKDILDQTYDVFKLDAFQIPTNFAFLGRAVGTLSGLCTGLDPDFQFADVAGPYARRLMTEGHSRRATLQLARKEAGQLLLTASRLPRLSEQVLEGFSDAEWLRRDLSNVSRALVRVERMVRALLIGLLATAFLISGAFLAPKYHDLAIVSLVITLLLLMRVVLFMLTSRRPPL